MKTYWEPEGFHQLGRDEYSKVMAIDVLTRMKEATGAATMKELAIWLGVRQADLFDVIRRNIIPIRWLRLLALRKNNHNPSWVLTGQGEKYW